MIVKLPFVGHPCCIPQPIILKVKNPMYLAVNEGKTSDYKYFVGGTIRDFEKTMFKSEYIVDIPDSQFVQNVPQLYLKDFDKWSTDTVLVEYINEQTSGSGITYVATDTTLTGNGTPDNPLGLNIDIIDGRH